MHTGPTAIQSGRTCLLYHAKNALIVSLAPSASYHLGMWITPKIVDKNILRRAWNIIRSVQKTVSL